MALDAVIFDVDGTLVDTNAHHVEAFRRAFETAGYRVDADRIARQMGQGGDQLVPAILGAAADGAVGDAVRAGHPVHYERLAKDRPPRAFPRAVELLRDVRRRGLTVVVATSGGRAHVRATRDATGLDVEAESDVLVTGDDVARSKPHPDLVVAAFRQAGMSAAQCALVGDTPFDATSAKRAGVVCLGVTTGGFSESELLGAGARRAYANVADLLEGLDDALRVASPGPARLSQARLDELMRHALAAARAGMNAGEAPIGCALFRGDLSLVATGFNEMNASRNKTAHAEIVTFARAAGKVPMDARDLVLVSTLEPCVMCTGAAMEAAVDTVVYALRAPADSGSDRVAPPSSPESQMPRIVGDVLSAESRRLFEEFLAGSPKPEQATYVKQLLNQS